MAPFPSGHQAKKALSARLTDIPRQKLRLLQQLAEREQAQQCLEKYWATRLLTIFGLAIALYLGSLLISLFIRG